MSPNFFCLIVADVNLPDSFGKTPLHNAILGNQVSVVEMLLRSGADVKATDERGDTPLHTAVRVGNEEIVAVWINIVKRGHFNKPHTAITATGEIRSSQRFTHKIENI